MAKHCLQQKRVPLYSNQWTGGRRVIEAESDLPICVLTCPPVATLQTRWLAPMEAERGCSEAAVGDSSKTTSLVHPSKIDCSDHGQARNSKHWLCSSNCLPCQRISWACRKPHFRSSWPWDQVRGHGHKCGLIYGNRYQPPFCTNIKFDLIDHPKRFIGDEATNRSTNLFILTIYWYKEETYTQTINASTSVGVINTQ